MIGAEFDPGIYRVKGYWELLDETFFIFFQSDVVDDGFGLVVLPETAVGYIGLGGEAVALSDFEVVPLLSSGYSQGTYLVNTDIDPGRYRVSAAGNHPRYCSPDLYDFAYGAPSPDTDFAFAARLRPLPNGGWDVIDSECNEDSVIIEIQATDFAFQFSGLLEAI